MPTAREIEMHDALRAALEWIDAVPQDTVLPAMPGFDRDWVDGLIYDIDREVKAKARPVEEDQFITDYKAAYAAANPDMAAPTVLKRAAGWYDITPSSGNSYRKSDIIKMTQTLLRRATLAKAG